MGGACSTGQMGRISSEEYSSEHPKMDSYNNIESNNNKKKKTFRSVRSFPKLMTRSKSDTFDHAKTTSSSPRLFDSGELRYSDLNPRLSVDQKVPPKGSFLGRASLSKAVDMVDTLGSKITDLNNSGFLAGKMTKGNKISILAFEVANTITRGAILMLSLSEENVRFIKEEVIPSEGVRYLVSTNMKVLLSLAASDKRAELDFFCKEVIRFGDLCKDAQWHNLDRFFAKLDSENAVYRPEREKAEKKLQELMTLAQHTSELYHELNALDRFEQDYRQKVEEMKSLNLPRRGEHIMMLQGELRQQKKIVMSLKKKSLWSKKLEEVVEMLVEIVAFIHQEIMEVFEAGGTKAGERADASKPRLGALGLALHYANMINQIDNIASRPTSLPPNIRDTLYQGLPVTVKASLRSVLRKLDPDELDIQRIRAEMEKILEWLSPMAVNTLKMHQGFGWVGEWANASIEFNKKTAGSGNLIRLQTLYHADKEKMDSYIFTLVTLLHQLISGMRRRDHGLKPFQLHSPSKKIMILHSAMKSIPSPNDGIKTLRVELSEEDRRLLEQMSKRSFAPGISKSQEFASIFPRTAKSWKWSRSMESSPHREQRRTCPELLEGSHLDSMSSGLEAPF